ncbi:uncharacterized protein LOC133205079 [Saccostrea echinata]|uniref:uncharacterized protein LOC133205079 n=1 Tax=Saccostrea echinata TaxID=191078 RepID=UPI002A82EC59|nr:uncharacterized protein LOC133205079 [Saccostrea echinata]
MSGKVTRRANRKFARTEEAPEEGKPPTGDIYKRRFNTDDSFQAEFQSESMRQTTPLSKYEFNTKEGLKVLIYEGSITHLDVDCIVNAANENLMHGGGIAFAISEAAGYVFDEESKDYIAKHGQIPVGTCAVTSAGKLPYKYVIHSVGPRWSDYTDKDRCLRDLCESVEVTFREADKLGMKSIALPSISSGIFGVPRDKCVEQYHKAVTTFSRSYPFLRLREIHFVDRDASMVSALQVVFQQKTSRLNNTEPSKAPYERKLQGANDDKLSPIHHEMHLKHFSNCCICMDQLTNPQRLPKCGHIFCKKCIKQYLDYKPACPTCGQIYGKMTGNQPPGSISIKKSYQRLQGVHDCNSFVIKISIYSQTDHPNPGKMYKGISRSGYLPNNEKGCLVAKLLNVAFSRRLVFTIGRSRTTGQGGVITWNDILHKTRPDGGPIKFGYPDDTYLEGVMAELSAKGVTPESADDPREYSEYSKFVSYS